MKKDKGKSDNSRIGKWLAEKREEKDLSQQYVADRLDINKKSGRLGITMPFLPFSSSAGTSAAVLPLVSLTFL